MNETLAKVANVAKTVLREAVRIKDNPQDNDPYPETVQECIDDTLKYKPGTEACIKRFRDSHPWSGTQAEMQYKLRVLNNELAKVYEIKEPALVFVEKFPAGPCCFPKSKPAMIVMEPEDDGRYSVITFLHEFGHCLKKNERYACRWSLNLFKRFFPQSFEKLEPHGHCLYRKRKA